MMTQDFKIETTTILNDVKMLNEGVKNCIFQKTAMEKIQSKDHLQHPVPAKLSISLKVIHLNK
jgi:hypothetical protein